MYQTGALGSPIGYISKPTQRCAQPVGDGNMNEIRRGAIPPFRVGLGWVSRALFLDVGFYRVSDRKSRFSEVSI